MAGLDVSEIGAYPKLLNEADWLKKEGPTGKAAKTGLGDEMKKAEALFKKVVIAKLQLPKAPDTEDQLDAALKAVNAYYKTVGEPLIKQLRAVEATAKKAQATLTKVNPVAAKSAGEAAKAAANYATDWKNLDFTKAVMIARASLLKDNKAENKAIDESIKKFIAGAKKFLEDGSADAWGLHIQTQGENLTKALRANERYVRKFWKQFAKFKGFNLSSLRLMDNDAQSRERRTTLVKTALVQAVSMSKFDR